MPIHIHLHPQACAKDRLWAYQIAARTLLIDIPFAELTPFRVVKSIPASYVYVNSLVPPSVVTELVYQGSSWLGGEVRQVACWSGVKGYQLAVQEAGLFEVAPNGGQIVRHQATSNPSVSLTVLTLLGPALTLALALQGTWCLHASAVAIGQHTIAFIGHSTAGKSTLVRYLGTMSPESSHSEQREQSESQKGAPPILQRIADDVLPIEAGADGLVALPHFPQLKLPAEKQVAKEHPSRLTIDAIYLLNTSKRATGIKIEPIAAHQAALTLVQHTVAARLFNRRLLSQHLAFCTQAAITVPIRRLTYPHNFNLLPQVAKMIEEDWLMVA